MKKLLLALTLSVASSVTAFAQNDAGLIGKRYAAADLFIEDTRKGSGTGYGTNLGITLPVATGIDINFGYTFESVEVNNIDGDGHGITAEALFYSKENASYTPYIGVGLGYQSLDKDSIGTEDDSFYQGRIGLEFPFAAKTAADVGVSYSDTFDENGEGSTTIYGSVNHILTDKLTLVGGVRFVESDSVVFHAGIRYRF